jgi:very-short-patch-repair endonuclease
MRFFEIFKMKTAKELKNYKGKLKTHMTKEEKYVEDQLKLIGIEYKKQMILGFYIMDFILPTKMINIEVDGGIHKETAKRDYLRDKFTNKCGFIVIRIKNEDIYSFDYNGLLKYPEFNLPQFRTGLALANSYRGVAKAKQKINKNNLKIIWKCQK